MNKFYTNLSEMILKYGEQLKKIVVFCCVIILATEIVILKKVIINILNFMISQKLLLDGGVRIFRNIYTVCRSISFFIVFLCILLFTIYYLVRPLLEKLAKVNPITPFEESFSKYLCDKSGKFSKKGYLVSGDWGSGKTYLVEEFFKRHFRFSKRPVYKVSCFGLESRELVLKEIETQIEEKDKSFLKWVQYVPIIGLPIFGILKKTYSLQNISPDSIFIFDDFERITPSGIVTHSFGNNFYDRKRINTINRGFSSRSDSQGLKEMDEELTKIQKSFNKIISQNNNETLNINIQKYNVVTGLINELIENNNVKVVIICNTDIIGNNYMDKVFRGKLDCITYRKNAERESLVNIFNKSLQNQVFENKEIYNNLLKKTEYIIEEFELIWLSNGTNNLREVKSIFQAFLDTTSEIETFIDMSKLENIFSLLYSIYIVSMSIEKMDIEKFEFFPEGGNLLFYLELYGKNEEADLIRKSKYCNKLKWFGISLSGYWMLNFSRPKDIQKKLENYESYRFNQLENELTNFQNISNLVFEEVTSEHILYIINKEAHISKEYRTNKLDSISRQFLDYLPQILLETDDVYFTSQQFLLSINSLLGGTFYSDFLKKWLVAIYDITKIESFEIEGNAFVLNEYNNFIRNKDNLLLDNN